VASAVVLLERESLVNCDIFDIWLMLGNNWDTNQKLLEKIIFLLKVRLKG